jgi:hypothetical protein
MKAFFESKENCFICGQNLKLKKKDGTFEKLVYDHDHTLSQVCEPRLRFSPYPVNVRGISHNSCNLALKEKRYFVLGAHNMSAFDGKLILRYLSSRGADLRAIAKSAEIYITFTWFLKLSEKLKVKVNFIDTYRFVSKPLSQIMENLGDDCPYFKSWFKRTYPTVQFDQRFVSKSAMCYEYLTSFEVFKETKFPSYDKFYSKLRGSNVTLEDYQWSLHVFQTLKCKKFG